MFTKLYCHIIIFGYKIIMGLYFIYMINNLSLSLSQSDHNKGLLLYLNISFLFLFLFLFLLKLSQKVNLRR